MTTHHSSLQFEKVNSQSFKPNLFGHQSIKSFLNAFVEMKKKDNSKWTLGQWAKQLGLAQTASLSRVLSGERKAGPVLIKAFIDYFDFSPNEAEFFRYLGVLERVENDPDIYLLTIQKLKSLHPSGDFFYVRFDLDQAIANWYYECLIEMTRLPDFKNCIDWIQQNLLFPLSKEEIDQAIKTLIRLELLQYNEDSKLVPTSYFREYPQDIVNQAARENVRQNLRLALDAIESVPIEKREFNNLIFCLKNSDISLAKEMIREFRKKFCQAIDSPKADEVYVLQIELFPYTKIQSIQ